MINPFKKPEVNSKQAITFMVYGGPSTGKTTFSLKMFECTNKPSALINTDNGAKFYGDKYQYQEVKTSKLEDIKAGTNYIFETKARDFGCVIIDSLTEVWMEEQDKFTKRDKNGDDRIPMNAWQPLRKEHRSMMRRFRGLPVHVIFICEGKMVGNMQEGDKQEFKEDADKKDAHKVDVHLELFKEKGKFYARVHKDITGKFKLDQLIENPHPKMWIDYAAETAVEDESHDEDNDITAQTIYNQISEDLSLISNMEEFNSWKTANKEGLARLQDMDAPLKEKIVQAAQKVYAELKTKEK